MRRRRLLHLALEVFVLPFLACLVGGEARLFAQEAPPDSQAAKIAELERRVKELEEIISKIQVNPPPTQPALPAANTAAIQIPETKPEKIKVAPTPAYTPTPTPGLGGPAAGWKDGFFLRSDDQAHTLRITGQIQADYRSFLNPGDTTDIDTFLVRRARLGIEATVFNHYEFRLLPDFGQGKTTIQDAYLNIHYWDTLQIQVGKFKEPVSYEQLIQDRFVPTMERSLIDQIVPARDVGLMVHGKELWDGRLDYALGIFNGEINGDLDTNKLRDVAGRLAIRPFLLKGCPECIHGLQIGISATTGIEQEPISPVTLRTPGTVPWLTFNPTVRANGLRNRWAPELSYFCGPLGFVAQYMHMDQEMQAALAGPGSGRIIDVPFDGCFILLTYLLTGEERKTYNRALAPDRPFDPAHPLTSPGAWELVLRWSHLDVGDVVFAPVPFRLADPARFSPSASELTVGFNWYLTSLVRVQFNWEHAWFGSPVLLGPGANPRHSDTLLTRLQVIF